MYSPAPPHAFCLGVSQSLEHESAYPKIGGLLYSEVTTLTLSGSQELSPLIPNDGLEGLLFLSLRALSRIRDLNK